MSEHLHPLKVLHVHQELIFAVACQVVEFVKTCARTQCVGYSLKHTNSGRNLSDEARFDSSLTQPVFSSRVTKADMVLIPVPVEVHRAVRPLLEHLTGQMHIKCEVLLV